jgi:hypothetical protein
MLDQVIRPPAKKWKVIHRRAAILFRPECRTANRKIGLDGFGIRRQE